MSSDSAETTDRTDTSEARARLEALTGHLPRNDSRFEERLTVIHGHVTDYEEADSESEQRDIVDRIEAELDELRDTIESELEEGEEKAHELTDKLERKISNLR